MPRARLTSHPREVLEDLSRRSQNSPDGWVLVTPRSGYQHLGALGAVRHLIDKGYAESRLEVGPQGGNYLYARPAS